MPYLHKRPAVARDRWRVEGYPVRGCGVPVKQRASVDEGALALRAERRILLLRGHKVLLDSDLAELYGVPTGRLNEQVRRNRNRFPPDFMLELSEEEFSALRSQIAISKSEP